MQTNNPNDPIPWMSELAVFQGFSEAEMGTLATAFSVRLVRKDDVICKEGAPAPSFFIIASGKVGVFKEIPGAKRQRVGTTRRNQMLGQISLIDGGRRHATMVADANVVLLECQRDIFERLFQANNPFAYKLLDFVVCDLSQRLREANSALEDLLANPGQSLTNLYDRFLEVGKKIHESGSFESPHRRDS